MESTTFEALREHLKNEKSDEIREKDEELYNELEGKNVEFLSNYQSLQNDPEFMLPLLYAYYNKHQSFEVFTKCGPEIQNIRELADQVVRAQPEIIKKTILIDDPEFIARNIEAVPVLEDYISNKMKEHPAVEQALERMHQPDIMIEAAKVTLDTMAVLGAINIMGNEYTIEQLESASMIPHIENFTKEDFSFFQEIHAEKRDDANYLKEIVAKNLNAAAYIAEHVDDFEIQGLDAVTEQMDESVIDKARKVFEEQLQEVEAELQESPDDEEKKSRLSHLKEQIQFLNDIQQAENGESRFPPEEAVENLCEGLDDKTRDELQQYLKIAKTVTQKKNTPEYVLDYVTKNPEQTGEKITYVATKAKTFGVDSLDTVKDIATNRTKATAREELEQELEALKKKEQEGTITEEEKEQKEQLDKISLFIDSAEKRIKEGKTTPERVSRLVDGLCKKLDPKYHKMLHEIVQIGEAANEKRSHDDKSKAEEPAKHSPETDNISHEELRARVKEEVTTEGITLAARALNQGIENTENAIPTPEAEQQEPKQDEIEN